MRVVLGFFDVGLARIAWLAAAAGLSYTSWRSIDSVGATVVTAAALVSILSTMLWLSGAGLRAVRCAAGGLTAVSGFLLTLQLSLMAGPNGIPDTRGLSGWLTIAVVYAGLGGLLCDERKARREALDERQRDGIAARRHAEVLQVVQGRRHHGRGASRGPAIHAGRVVARRRTSENAALSPYAQSGAPA
jgi:signal transduction histidine kinase